MAKITLDMKDIASKANIFMMATSTRKGKPNGVPIAFARIISDDEILLLDSFMHKTRQNIEENPVAAVTFWSKTDGYGYQFKGKARRETSGQLFEQLCQGHKSEGPKFPARAVVVVKVDEIYYVGANKDSAKNLV